MSLFRKLDQKTLADLSNDLRERDSWKLGVFRTLNYALHVTAIATEPVSGLLAYGSADGTILIFGRPGVEVKLLLPEPDVGVKFLEICLSCYRLVCVDDSDQMHIWDLSVFGQPIYLTSVKFDAITSIAVSPSHSHVFVCMQRGEIRTYDLEALRKSPYTMPNMWRLYQEKVMTASGGKKISDNSSFPIAIVPHPRDLNLVFVVYTGGVVLCNMTERTTSRVYELTIPPGAAGAGSGDILSERKPEATCLAIHPSGHMFVVGYEDGCFAFWAVEDEDQPLTVKTVDEEDVHLVNPDIFEARMEAQKRGTHQQASREPIFKITWSGWENSADPRGGNTAVSILGGLDPSSSPGISTYYLPPFNPGDPPTAASSTTQTFPRFFRDAMRHSLSDIASQFYYSKGIVQDYHLISAGNPHFNGTYDPFAILIISESAPGTNVAEAFEFPPPRFTKHQTDVALDTAPGALGDPLDDLQSTLRDMQLNDDPRPLLTPISLYQGSAGVLNGSLNRLEREVYQRLLGLGDHLADELRLRGGMPWSDETKVNDLKMSKYQPPRILMTAHSNLTVQFSDLSAHLLVGIPPDPLQQHFPQQLHDLTIDVNRALLDPVLSKIITPELTSHPVIQSIHLAPETLECIVVFKSGEIFVYRLSHSAGTDSRETHDTEILMLDYLVPLEKSRYSPFCMINAGKGAVTASAICDIGFLAIAYADKSLFVVDLRGPSVIMRQGPNVKSRHSTGLLLSKHASSDSFQSLTWAICAIENDSQSQLRLIAVRSSGTAQVLSFKNRDHVWSSSGDKKFEAAPDPLPGSGFVMKLKTGTRCVANRSMLNSIQDHENSQVIFVSAGIKSVRCILDVTGDRIGKADWATNGTVQSVQVVERLASSQALIATTDQQEALVYSLPHLELIDKVSLPAKSTIPVTIDDTGDFITWIRDPSGLIAKGVYGTFFDFRRAMTLPEVDFAATRPTIPTAPQPVSMGPASLLGSWFRFAQTISGAQLDALLGGPDRPAAVPTPQPRTIQPTGHSAAQLAATARPEEVGLYNRLQSALSDRGDMLGDLQDRFNSLEQDSQGMVNQAKKLATQQTAKAWFSGWS